MIDLNPTLRKARDFGADAAAMISTGDVVFVEEFRAACEMNTCGHYGKNWMCPPAVGEPGVLRERLLAFERGVVMQTVHRLEDSFDVDGMRAGREKHEVVFRRMFAHVQSIAGEGDFLALNVGAWKYCEECAFVREEPCRYPDKAVASLEAYCIDVNALLTACGIPYNNGVNTVSYVSLILFM